MTDRRQQNFDRLETRRRTIDKRWDRAIDRILNSGLMYEFIDDFWAYIDGEITWAEFNQRMSP